MPIPNYITINHCVLFLIIGWSAVFVNPAEAQTVNIDSLKFVISANTNPETKSKGLVLLLGQEQRLHPDTLLRYAQIAKSIGIKLKNSLTVFQAEYYTAYALQGKGLIDSALGVLNSNIGLHKENEESRKTLIRYQNLTAVLYIKKKEYKSAMAAFYSLLQDAEKRNDTFPRLMATSGIGWINMEMSQWETAVTWFYKAISISGNSEHTKRLSPVYSNIAASYNALHKNDSALKYIKVAITLAKAANNLSAIANSLNIQGNILIDSKQTAAAEQVLTEAIEIRKKIGDPFFIVSDITQLALFYLNIGRPDKGIALAKEGIVLADSFKLVAKLPILYDALASNYKAAGKYEEYGAALKKIIELKDTIYKHNSAEALSELHAAYDVQKKENTIIQQKLSLVRKNSLIAGISALAFLALLLGAFIFINYRRKQRAKAQAEIEKEKLNTYRSVIAAEENERRRIAADLHDNLGSYAAAISSNIDILTEGKAYSESVPLNELRNSSGYMVSMLGDTIWALKKKAVSLTDISDRLKVFLQQLQNSYPRITTGVTEDITEDVLLPPSAAFHLFKILQEGINNALRHSGGTEINISVSSANSWQIRITDNGRGISEGETRSDNGLENMKDRSRKAGFSILWQNNRPKGTEVIISPSA